MERRLTASFIWHFKGALNVLTWKLNFSLISFLKTQINKKLFQWKYSAWNPSRTSFLNATQETCEDLYIYIFFFYNLLFLKWSRLKGAIIPPQVHQPLMFRLSSSLNHFEPVSPVQVSDIALKMKCAICKLDVLSLCLFKHVFTTIVSLVEWHLKSAFHFQDFRESCLHTSLLLPK